MRVVTIFLVISIFCIQGYTQTYIDPEVVCILDGTIDETSGLVNLDEELWTHNDSGGSDHLYQIDTDNGEVIRDVKITDADNEDWEDLAFDEDHVYIGDFGNNEGDRTDLIVYRIDRDDLETSDEVDADEIEFIYSDQTSWVPNHNNHDFDCEALICYEEKLYLFSKNWVDNQTRVYELSTEPGEHVAQYLATFDVNCMITGAEILPASNSLVLTGYNLNGTTYTWLFNDFQGVDFFGGESTQFLWPMLTQIEGISYDEGYTAYVSSEEFAGVIDPKLYRVDFTEYISSNNLLSSEEIIIYGYQGNIYINSDNNNELSGEFSVYNLSGQIVKKIQHSGSFQTYECKNLTHGIYFVTFYSKESGLIQKKIVL